MSLVHLHARYDEGGRGCRTVCGVPCDECAVAYRGLDPERVTCPSCYAYAVHEHILPRGGVTQ